MNHFSFTKQAQYRDKYKDRMIQCPKCSGLMFPPSKKCWGCYVDPRTRFESKYKIADNGCWEWSGARNILSYGVSRYDGRKIGAHRLAWMLLRGAIPEGLHVLHHCDNPPCVNPEHLFLGTQADNNYDSTVKGRRCRGEARSKLTAEQVLMIRSSPKGDTELARELGLDPSSVCHIRRRRTWRHI